MAAFYKKSLSKNRFFFIGAMVFCVVLIIGGFIVFSDYIAAPRISLPEALGGIEADSVQVIYVGNLAMFTTNVPPGTNFIIFEAKLPTGERQHRLILENNLAGTLHQYYVGVLEYQLPESPLQTIMFDVGGDRFIVGYIDETILGTPDSIWFTRISGYPNERSLGLQTKVSVVNNRTFLIPIFMTQPDYHYWHAITEARVYTLESRKQQDGSPDFNLLGYEWINVYDPELEIDQLFTVIHFYLPNSSN